MSLVSSGLIRQKSYINGKWIGDDSHSSVSITNPATSEEITQVYQLDKSETQIAIECANQALSPWKKLTASERASVLMQWYELIVKNTDELAELITLEQGKPLAESKGEITYAASFIRWYSEEAKRVYGEVITPHQSDKRLMVVKQPVGVTAAITPWNFPAAMITRKAAAALAAGCTMIVKPAPDTPLTALAMAELADRAGIPAGVFNVICGDAKQIGETLCDSPIVRKLSFTGSTPVGRLLMAQSAKTLKKLSLELGGNAPFIVFNDADINAAVAGAILCKFRNAGQTCVCANRLYIQAEVYDEFAQKLKVAVQKLNVGHGSVEGIDVGPLINSAAIDKVENHIADALRLGGELLTGGTRQHGEKFEQGNFFEPTIIKNANNKMLIAHEETFGPVAPLFKFETVDDVIKQANETEFGLAAYFFARDISTVWQVSEALEYGMVGVNTGIISTEVAPFGGVKSSGLGREGGHQGLSEYLETKYICMSI
ncbi:succinate-semialdehyde dehydrogenase (NADP(+)) [Shewanella sp. OPT22]|nr:succinate-semialdehyde dehydrogenase (NADP(+)) [Shewanella sp. OPT22]